MNFEFPTERKIKKVFEMYSDTNRFIITANNIKLYNDIFKQTKKKFYVENTEDNILITFLRRNNKILLNFNNIRYSIKIVLLQNLLLDILRNVEVIRLNKEDFEKYKDKITK
jgi:hypothetical protein